MFWTLILIVAALLLANLSAFPRSSAQHVDPQIARRSAIQDAEATVPSCPLPLAYRQVSEEDERASRDIRGNEPFSSEQETEELGVRLKELGSWLRQSVTKAVERSR
jgi:hypothetical protein